MRLPWKARIIKLFIDFFIYFQKKEYLCVSLLRLAKFRKKQNNDVE